MSQKTPVTVAHGHGIGAHIMRASLYIVYDIVSTERQRALNGRQGFTLAQDR